jgi:hypothetical protein
MPSGPCSLHSCCSAYSTTFSGKWTVQTVYGLPCFCLSVRNSLLPQWPARSFTTKMASISVAICWDSKHAGILNDIFMPSTRSCSVSTTWPQRPMSIMWLMILFCRASEVRKMSPIFFSL